LPIFKKDRYLYPPLKRFWNLPSDSGIHQHGPIDWFSQQICFLSWISPKMMKGLCHSNFSFKWEDKLRIVHVQIGKDMFLTQYEQIDKGFI
jgi:hypothetical protein